MTREETIADIRDNIKPVVGGKSLDMAIKALEQEPCEDCISRQATIKYLCTNMNWYDEDGETADDEEKLNAITDLVNGVPSVTPQPKIGHWKRISIDKYVQHAMAYYKCSVCDKDIIGTHNYCPNCGAKMSEIPTSPERNGKAESEVEE